MMRIIFWFEFGVIDLKFLSKLKHGPTTVNKSPLNYICKLSYIA